MKGDTRGIVIRKNGSASIICQSCGKFASSTDVIERVAPSVGDPFEPDYWYEHKAGCGCKKEMS